MEGPIRVLRAALATEDEDDHLLAAETLANLAETERVRATVAEQGGVELVMALRNSSGVEVQREIARALRNLACDEEAAVAFVREGGIEYLVGKAIELEADEEVQSYAAQALASVAADHTERLLRANGLDALLQLATSEDGEVQICSGEAILSLVQTETGADAFFTGADQAGEILVAMADSAQPDVRDAARRVAERLESYEKAEAQQPGTPRVSIIGLGSHLRKVLSRRASTGGGEAV